MDLTTKELSGMKKLIICCFTVLLIYIPIIADAQNTDSILNIYRNRQGIYNVDSLLSKGKLMMFSNPDKSLELLKKTIGIAAKQADPIRLADSYRAVGAFYMDIKGDANTATYHYQKADSIYRKSKGKKGIDGVAAIYHCYGVIHQRQSDYLTSIDYYTKALHIFDSIGNETIRTKTLNNLSTLYSYLKDNAKAEEYARECLKLSEKNKDDYLISTISTTLASVLINQGKYEEVPALLDKAEDIAKSRNDYYILDLVNLNYGSYHLFFKKDHHHAIQHYLLAIKYAEKIGNEYEKLRAMTNLSESYLMDKQLKKAQETAQESFVIVEKIGSDDIRQRLLTVLAKTEAADGEFEKAYKHLISASELKDSVFNESNAQNINFLEAKYQTEKKELRISALEKERKLYRFITLSGAFTLLLLLLIFYFMHSSNRRKKQLAEQKIIQLEKEKQLVATQAVLDGETAERSRLARDLHDGLGGMLSAVKLNLFDMKHGVFIEAEDVSRFNKVMEMLDNSMQELRRVAHNMMPESLSRYGLKVALEDFCGSFNNVQFHFFGEEKRIDKSIEIALYRVVFELVNNAVKHSKADTINVQIIQQPNRISINVQDDGKGFDPEEATKGAGLQNIRNRINSVGGTLNILSSKEEGTEIIIDIDLNEG